MKRRLEVGNRFNYTEVGLYGRLYEVFAISRDGAAAYGYSSARKLVNFFEFFNYYVHGLAVIGLIVRIEYAAVGGNQYEFCGR